MDTAIISRIDDTGKLVIDVEEGTLRAHWDEQDTEGHHIGLLRRRRTLSGAQSVVAFEPEDWEHGIPGKMQGHWVTLYGAHSNAIIYYPITTEAFLAVRALERDLQEA